MCFGSKKCSNKIKQQCCNAFSKWYSMSCEAIGCFLIDGELHQSASYISLIVAQINQSSCALEEVFCFGPASLMDTLPQREREEHQYIPGVVHFQFVFCCDYMLLCYWALMDDSVSRLLLFCVFLAVVWSSVLAGRSDVTELKDLDFDYIAAEQETMLVKFYAPW